MLHSQLCLPKLTMDKSTLVDTLASHKGLPPVFVLLMNFMDRTAIGNARLYNMEEDLGLGEGEYQLAVSVLFITYCLFEVVSLQTHNELA